MRNRVAAPVLKWIEQHPETSESVLASLPRFRQFMHLKKQKAANDLIAFGTVHSKMAEKGIDTILIKSDGTFPSDSDNLDVLIRQDDLRDAFSILLRCGYREDPSVREPNKFLYKDTGKGCMVHVHTKVEWEGVEFVNASDVWERKRKADFGPLAVSVPSAEHFLLITFAHLFFEDHEVKLRDIAGIETCLRDDSVDWDRIACAAADLGWGDAFSLVVLVAGEVFDQLYGRDGALPTVKSRGLRFLSSIIGVGHVRRLPVKIPYIVPAYFFAIKVLTEEEWNVLRATKRLSLVACDVLRRRIGLQAIVLRSSLDPDHSIDLLT